MPIPKISVIVPAYNEAKSIGLCLTSLKNQDYRHPYEIIVVDNNSTDSTAAIAKKFNIRVVSETKAGPGRARNAGAKVARGQILAFIDADSIAPSDWLDNINNAFSSQPDLAALVGIYRFHHKSKYRLIPFLIFPLGEMLNKMITGYFSFGGANFAIKKKVFTTVGGFDSKFFSFEDMELARRVSRVGKIGYLHELEVKTSDRRLRYGINRYLKYGLPIFLSFAFLNKPSKKIFPNIRS
ncbi:MAG: glycosyltransferase [Candidatus Beckwithbacteria bacterium]|nr:glycosyltransferase [Candidatus Beckwithbacteria bacterium]